MTKSGLKILERPARIKCESCKGSGNGPSGKCIHTGEIVNAECPDCGGRRWRASLTSC